MLYTLADARLKIAPFVGDGSSSNTLVDMKINDALERLLDNRDWDCLKRQVRIVCVGNTFPLPYNAEKILWCDVDGTPASVFGHGYQYLSAGPGDLDYNSSKSGLKDLIDLGDYWAVQYEMPKKFTVSGTEVTVGEYALAAFSSTGGETTKSLRAYGEDARGVEVSGGELLPIQTWGVLGEGVYDASFTVTTSKFANVSRVSKDATTGYVDLYAVHAATSSMFLLARYHPGQTLPQFRRFRINNASAGTSGSASAVSSYNAALGTAPAITYSDVSGSTSVILAVVRLRHVPLSSPTDILPVDSLQALRFAVMAITAEDNKDFVLAEATMAKAIAVMSGRESANTMTKGTPTILDTGYRTSLGRRINRNRLL